MSNISRHYLQEKRKRMVLVFICPKTGHQFSSKDYSITENRGVVVDAQGTRTWDGKVVLDAPCPQCGEQHAYHVADLACPFSAKP
jgi:predicted RNA-binding Zn-ribbon protein involved in translation (DUF1610 family)